MKGKRLAPGVAYLGIPNVLTSKSDSSLSLEDIQNSWSCVAANVVKKAAEEYVVHLKSGLSKDEAMERTSQSRFIAAKVHTMGSIFEFFKESVAEMEETAETKLLNTVCRLYGLWQIEEQQGYFLKCTRSPCICQCPDNRADGYFDAAQMDKVQESVDALCAEIRKVAGLS